MEVERWWWLSTERMTVTVGVDDEGVVRTAPPIVRKFIGQHVSRLTAWMRKQPGFRSERG